MKQNIRILLTTVIMLTLAASLQAQKAGSKWSVYAVGGINSFQGVRSELYAGTPQASPEFGLGVSLHTSSALRFSAEASYAMLRERCKEVTSTTLTDPDFTIGGHQTTLTTRVDCIQNKNRLQTGSLQVMAEYNLSAASSWLGIYIGAGVGGMYGDNRNTQIISYNAEAEAKGDGYHNVYSHAYIQSPRQHNSFTTLYLPALLTVEVGVLPNVALGLRGQYRWLPFSTDFAPKSLYGGSFLLRLSL